MKQGILVVAAGHPYYGKMAYNLAATIKAMDAEFPVAVITDGEKRGLSHLTDDQQSLFDHVIITGAADQMGSGGKLLAYEFTPFDQTLIIDADNLWLTGRKPSELFDRLKGTRFAAIVEGHIVFGTNGPKKENPPKKAAKTKSSKQIDETVDDGPTSGDDNQLNDQYPVWADPKEIRKVYKLQKLYQLRSETIYFEKSKQAETIFERAREVFQNPKVTPTRWGAQTMADELAFNIAVSSTGLDIPSDFNPTWWAAKAGGRVPMPHQIAKDYYIFSTGGNHANTAIKKNYNQIAAFAFSKIGRPFRFELKSKISTLPERSKY